MESLGEILRRRGAPSATSAGGTATWSDTEPEDERPPCPQCKGAGFVHPRQPSGQPDYARLIPCQCTQKKLDDSRLERLQSYSNLGALTHLSFHNLVLEGKTDDPANQERFIRAYRAAVAFAANPQGWLIFLGPSGSGKTHLAAAIANQRLQEGHQALFFAAPDLLDRLRSTLDGNNDTSYQELFAEVESTPLLVLDDLGTQSSTPWAEEKLFQIVNHRFQARLPTVINVAAGATLDELEERWRTRLADPGLSQIHLLEVRKPSLLDCSGSMGLELLKSMTFDNFDCKRVNLPLEQRRNLEHACELARRFSESPEGWLILQGENGCGKTHLAASIANHRLKKGHPVSFVVVSEFLDHLRSTFGPESKVTYDDLFERVKSAPLLILDDYGEHSSTPWAQEKLYQLINYRYNARLPMVVTMCCSLDELDESERRVSSRLSDVRLSTVYYISAPDYRADHAQSRKPSGDSRPNRRT
ncbi:MAG: AAA family ATPase [Chloroflexi bacterium]|nr:AAA family ATPase [Chloroflexota bacterium]